MKQKNTKVKKCQSGKASFTFLPPWWRKKRRALRINVVACDQDRWYAGLSVKVAGCCSLLLWAGHPALMACMSA